MCSNASDLKIRETVHNRNVFVEPVSSYLHVECTEQSSVVVLVLVIRSS